VQTLAVIWRAAGLRMATDARTIVEVLPPVSCRPGAGAPEWLRGLFAYRGALIPLVDATQLLGTARESDRMFNRVLVVRVGTVNAPVDWLVGLWVESVLEIERVDFESAGGHPGFGTDVRRFLGPVAQTRLGQVQLVRSEELFTPQQAAMIMQRLTEAAA